MTHKLIQKHILYGKREFELRDDFIKIKFLDIGKKLEFKFPKTLKGIVKWLVQKKIITLDGEINYDKVDLFIENYDENITNRTIRN